MLIIAEGIDGSGKTTLIDDLSHEFENPDIIHRGPLKQHPLEEYELPLIAYDPRKDVGVLCDRWHIGELIYGPLYRGQSQLTPAMQLHVDCVLERLGALKLIMAPPFEVVQQRISRRGEEFLRPQHQRLVYDAYLEQCTYLDGWTQVSVKYRVETLIREAELRATRAEMLMRFPTYVGAFKPKVLLLGDVHGPRRQRRPEYPWAFVPYRDTSGHFLFEALSSAGFRASDFGVANANQEDVLDLWSALDMPKIVVLGREAEKSLDQYAEPILEASVVKVMQHPQYVKRFYNTSLQAYGAAFEEVLRG